MAVRCEVVSLGISIPELPEVDTTSRAAFGFGVLVPIPTPDCAYMNREVNTKQHVLSDEIRNFFIIGKAG